jgi:hypothetical protein
MRAMVLLAAVVLAGCAGPELAGNAEGGVVTYGTSRASQDWHGRGANVGFSMAERHCRSFGRAARVLTVDDLGGALVFECLRT